MSRWAPGARDRLERAALELFLEQGFEGTTVPQITARAGLTTRTFFRHFADKREVLFAGEDEIPVFARRLVADAPDELGPMEVVAVGLRTMATTTFQDRGADWVRERRIVIDGDDGLRERELHKLSALSDAIAAGFRDRGLDDLSATLAAETAVTIFKVSLARWLEQDDTDLTAVVDETMRALGSLRPGGDGDARLVEDRAEVRGPATQERPRTDG